MAKIGGIDTANKHVECDAVVSLPREGGCPSAIGELQRNLDPRLRGERNGFNMFNCRINKWKRFIASTHP